MAPLRLMTAAFVALPILGLGFPQTSDAPKAPGGSVSIADSAQVDLQDQDDLEALVAWFYGSVSNTQIKPSDVFCGNCPKGKNCSGWKAPTGACTAKLAGRLAREHVEIRGWVSQIPDENGPRPGYTEVCNKCDDWGHCQNEFLF